MDAGKCKEKEETCKQWQESGHANLSANGLRQGENHHTGI